MSNEIKTSTKTKTCCYCGGIIKKYGDRKDMFYCDFCDLILNVTSTCVDGQRRTIQIRTSGLDVNYGKTTPELMVLSTFELLNLLKYSRTMRAENYDFCQTMKKLVKEAKKSASLNSDEHASLLNEAEKAADLYEFSTKKMFVLENLVCDRLGYIPSRITQRFLSDYVENMEKSKDGNMTTYRVKF